MESTKKRKLNTDPSAFAALPQNALDRIASFLPTIEDVQSFAQVSKGAHQATQAARTQIGTLGLTGKVTVGDQHLYTKDANSADTRFYFPTTLSGTTENFPHVTRRANAAHTPHLTDIATIHQPDMPNSLPSGNYPTRHRYDVQPDKRLSPVILPTKNAERKTLTMAPVNPATSGLSPMHHVAPRYKADVDAQKPVPGPGTPQLLTTAQTTPGGNPQNWTGQQVKFFKK